MKRWIQLHYCLKSDGDGRSRHTFAVTPQKPTGDVTATTSMFFGVYVHDQDSFTCFLWGVSTLKLAPPVNSSTLAYLQASIINLMLFKVTPFCKDCCQPVVAPGELQGLQIVWDVAPGACSALISSHRTTHASRPLSVLPQVQMAGCRLPGGRARRIICSLTAETHCALLEGEPGAWKSFLMCWAFGEDIYFDKFQVISLINSFTFN